MTAGTDTIAAIATAAVPAQGGVAIVRLSGTEAVTIGKALFRPAGRPVWESHRVLYGHICDRRGCELDEALLLWMQAPRSYTCEDVVEFHCHGGMMAVQSVLQACLQQGARLAEPGEFSLRAFLNGRIDLTQAESVSQLVGAQSASAAAAALAGIQGKLAQPIQALRSRCVNLLADIEARIDFEEDLPPLNIPAAIATLESLRNEVEAILATADRGELLHRGLDVAIVGRPNAGKSSLLNAWSGRDRAIVTDLPGTTRDVVESQLVVDGIPVRVLDTAGIRATDDRIELMGIERSRRVARAADLVILVVDATAGWRETEGEIYAILADRPVILTVNKIDLAPLETVAIPTAFERDRVVPTCFHPDTSIENNGIAALERAITEIATVGKATAANLDIAINQRQKAALLRARLALERVTITANSQAPFDFWTIDLRDTIHALGEITGEDATESILARIFSQFCIGK
ncbi:MAG: tRNA uridine-5-carboxymethylaminomethyl(34) synthesis GTPase MnmE [Cyanobacteria bacterium P01_D01_bin.123]